MRYKPRTEPFPHQTKATLRAIRQRNHAIFFEPRLGKTKAALDWVGILALKGEVKRVLVIAPRIALDVWGDQLKEHFTFNAHVEDFEQEWDISPRGGNTVTTEFWLAGREETFRATRDTRGRLQRPKQKILEEWSPDAIIFDESHEYKRPGGRGAQDAWRMVVRLRVQQGGRSGKPYVLLLSGTPSPKGWRDLFAQFRIMDQTLLGTSAGDFDERYCVYGQGARKYVILKYRNIKRLRAIVRENSTVCTARKAGLEGKLFFQSLRCNLPPKVKTRYNDLADNFATELEGKLVTAKNQGVKRLRLAQITGGFLTDGTQIHGEKLATTKAWLEILYGEAQNVILYCNFTPEVNAVGGVARRVGYNVRVIDGRTSKRDRSSALAEFKRSGVPRALVFQVQAGSVAIDLSTAAEVVFYSLPDGWVTFWQCLNRVRGPNQKRPVRVTAILARATVDVAKLESLRKKEDWHRSLMRDPKRYLGLIQ